MHIPLFQVSQVVTHSGIFHADEIFAIALLQFHLNRTLKVTRTRRITQILADPTIAVIDVGGVYDPTRANFDHHQDPDLPASNMLVLQAINPWYKYALQTKLFSRISDIDRGRPVPERTSYGVNRIIRSLNHLQDGFKLAIEFATAILQGLIAEETLFQEFDNQWKHFQRDVGDRVVIVEGQFPLGWMESVWDGPELLMLSGQQNHWQLTVRKGAPIVIPSDDRQKFRHNSGFIATYHAKAVALAHAKEIIGSIP